MTMEFKVQVPYLQNFKAPVKPSSKYSKMLAEAKLLCTEASQINEGWRKTFAVIRKMRKSLRNNPDGVFYEPEFEEVKDPSQETAVNLESTLNIKSPAKRKRIYKVRVEKNQSRLNLTSKK
eukprot:snap_masked-scaffold_6-processed-gene-13.19-mRNA-1 protein AED:1.00 eAED:1.00 QI:0/-1/0/0/-1/1/1/0/120